MTHRAVLVLLAACAFIAQIECKVHVITQYVTETVPADYDTYDTVNTVNTVNTVHTNVHVSAEVQARYPHINEKVDIPLKIPGVTDILNGVLNTLRIVIVKAIDIIYPIAPNAADQLYKILNQIVEAINDLLTPSGIGDLVKHLIIIVQDAIVGVEGLLKDAVILANKVAGPALQGVLSGLKGLLGSLKLVQPAANVASGLSGGLLGGGGGGVSVGKSGGSGGGLLGGLLG